MYELILIDADNTLFDYNQAEKFALQAALKSFDFTGNVDDIRADYKVINKAIWADLENGKITKEKLRTERFHRLFEKNGLTIPVELFSERYLGYLSEGSFLLKDAETVCGYLSGKYNFVLVTNGIKEVQHSRLDRSTIKGYFNEIVVSDEIGYSKPDPAFFDYTMNLVHHTDKTTTLIIGDSLTSDMRGGINYGIDTCWFNSESIENDSGLKPTYQIETLSDLYTIL
ncbi:MAG TPA: YjjG family noncanonical pyrimidine nucleotidase [Thermotogota bacterium]|nr:YjjG family noncanonical pyrimidine nucleotidase [Thermotogota bacterium]HPR96377.1 YjjG family noncanonical pyrimidine nucleotidase [Thermotogota bacterium]